MGQAQHFDQGQNWKAKNAASIRLRVGDGQKHAVETRHGEPALSAEQRRAAEDRREVQRAELAKSREAQDARRRGAVRDKRADDRTAERDHTPAGWKPANQRQGGQRYSDPLSAENDPRRKGERERNQAQAAGQGKPKRRRIVRPGN
jgi:hypothetical protein